MKTLTDLEKRKQQLLEELTSVNSEIVKNHNKNTNEITKEITKRIRFIKKELTEFKVTHNIK